MTKLPPELTREQILGFRDAFIVDDLKQLCDLALRAISESAATPPAERAERIGRLVCKYANEIDAGIAVDPNFATPTALSEFACEVAALSNPTREGWKLAPMEPTEKMLRDACAAMFEDVRFSRMAKCIKAGYKAALAAAPGSE